MPPRPIGEGSSRASATSGERLPVPLNNAWLGSPNGGMGGVGSEMSMSMTSRVDQWLRSADTNSDFFFFE